MDRILSISRDRRHIFVEMRSSQNNGPRSHSLEDVQTAGRAGVQLFGKAWVQSGGCHHVFSHDTFRKGNDTITTIYLHQNKIGDAGAVALAESLKAMFVTCILHVSMFLWQV